MTKIIDWCGRQIEIHEDGRIYNFFDPFWGLFKLKRVPLSHRWPTVWNEMDGRGGLQWWFKPWHRWRMSPGECEDYVGGFTIFGAYRNMIHRFGFEKICKLGVENDRHYQARQ